MCYLSSSRVPSLWTEYDYLVVVDLGKFTADVQKALNAPAPAVKSAGAEAKDSLFPFRAYAFVYVDVAYRVNRLHTTVWIPSCRCFVFALRSFGSCCRRQLKTSSTEPDIGDLGIDIDDEVYLSARTYRNFCFAALVACELSS